MYKCTHTQDAIRFDGLEIPPHWRFVLSSPKGFSQISLFGQGDAIDRDQRIQQYIFPSRYFYVYTPGGAELFSPTVVPVLQGVRDYSVEVRSYQIAYSAHSIAGTVCESRVCIDPETGAEVWEFSIINKSPAFLDLHFAAVIPFAKAYTIGDRGVVNAGRTAVGRLISPRFATTEQYRESLTVKKFTWLCSNRPCTSFSTDLHGILPFPETASRPLFIESGAMGNEYAYVSECCGAMDFAVPLAPAEQWSIRLALTVTVEENQAQTMVDRISTERPFTAARAHASSWNAGFTVRIPHPELQAFVNTFAQHQVRMCCETARWSLAPATRNWIQDWQAASYLRTRDAAGALFAALSSQHEDGFIPQGFTLSKQASLVNMHLMDFRDSPIWFPIFALTLVELTGDTGMMNRMCPFGDSGEATAFEHLFRGLNYLADRRGSHGIVLFGEGDWNDQLNNAGRGGKGESVWLSFAFIKACRDLIALAELCGIDCPDIVAEWIRVSIVSVNTQAWDGKWYLRGYTDRGIPFGTSQDKEGSLYLNPQAWSLIAGATETEQRAQSVLDAVNTHLRTPFGYLLLDPAYTAWQEDLGRITVDLPGNKENGSAYSHGTMFLAYGLLKTGRVDEALEVIESVLPTNPRNHFFQSGQNPAYIPNGYMGPAAGQKNIGRGSNHNWTGASSVLLWLMGHEIFGIRGSADCLVLRPSMPKTWDTVGCRILFRGLTLDIEYRRDIPKGAHLDGKVYIDGIVPMALLANGSRLQVGIEEVSGELEKIF